MRSATELPQQKAEQARKMISREGCVACSREPFDAYPMVPGVFRSVFLWSGVVLRHKLRRPAEHGTWKRCGVLAQC